MTGLESLAALSLVCNIVQLIEVGLKTSTLCKNAYRTGEIDPYLSGYAADLADSASSLTKSLNAIQGPLTEDDSKLLHLARKCCEAEVEWRQKTPARFLSQQHIRTRDRVGAVFKGVFNKSEIYRLGSQLEKAKDALETGLLVRIFERQDVSQAQSADLQHKLQTLLQLGSGGGEKLHKLIQEQVNLVITQMSDHFNRAEASSRLHITKELADHESRVKLHADQGTSNLLKEAEAGEDRRKENENYERFLRSFRYNDMNDRKNSIDPRHQSTFKWIFGNEDADTDPESSKDLASDRMSSASGSHLVAHKLVCDSFVKWLTNTSEDWYWISGKPGTGKSVLMKFIISSETTLDLLRQWQPQVQILTHFFWKAGSPMQSGFKGFLCSLAYQLACLNKNAALKDLERQRGRNDKADPTDWDSEELQQLIVSHLSDPFQPICLFIDGIDEFTNESGVHVLIDFLESLRGYSRLVKICVSSRPDQTIRKQLTRDPDLKMQDLTIHDIECYARSILNQVVARLSSPFDGDVETLVYDISIKAEGVFLWAILVVRSIRNGIARADSAESIKTMLSKTPTKLFDLYFQMWQGVGEDRVYYQDEMTMILNIMVIFWQERRSRRLEVTSIEKRNISILELMIASSNDLWSTPVDAVDNLSNAKLEQRCNAFRDRVPIITAGLLEVPGSLKGYITGERRKVVENSRDPVFRYNFFPVQAIHRTVFDFLLESDDGNKILRSCKVSAEGIFTRIVRTCLVRDCIWPEFEFLGWHSICATRNTQASKARARLYSYLSSISIYRDIMTESTMTEMLNLIYDFHLRMIRKISLSPTDYTMLPRCKSDYLQAVAERGFYPYVLENVNRLASEGRLDVIRQIMYGCCLGLRSHIVYDYPWAGPIDTIHNIIKVIVSSDHFDSLVLDEFFISSDVVARTAIAWILVSGIDALWAVQQSLVHIKQWNPDQGLDIIRMVIDFRQVLCLGDSLVIALNFEHTVPYSLPYSLISRPITVNCDGPSSYFFSLKSGSFLETEVTMSTLVEVFIQQVVQCDASFPRHEVENTLELKSFPQTIKPIRLRREENVVGILSADQSSFESYCQTVLLPETCRAGRNNYNHAMTLRDTGLKLVNDTFSRGKERIRVEEGDGPGELNFYLCSDCTAKRK